MSFLKLSFHNKQNIRKERDSLWTIHFYQIHTLNSERTSAFTSKASLTVEAAIVVPIFFFAMLCLVALLEMNVIRMTVKGALYSVARELGQQAYVLPTFTSLGVEEKLTKQIGTDRLKRSMIVNGTEGLDCSGSYADWDTGEMDLLVKYRLQVPLLMFRVPVISCEESLKVKGWTGQTSSLDGADNGQVVYVTKYGTVYHKNYNCTFLNPSIRSVDVSAIEGVRNHSGGKYYPCESCGQAGQVGFFYVSSYGNRYHTSLNCNKIKRNYYAITLEEAKGLGGCSKCVY